MRHYTLSAVLVLLSVSMMGCFEDMVARKTYDGPLQVEFAQYFQPFAPANTVQANWVSTVVFPHDAAGDAVRAVPLVLQLIGPQQSSPTEIGFRVAEQRVNAAGTVIPTTAQAGVHYRVPEGGTVTFPANSSHATLNVEALVGNLQHGQSVRLVLELTEHGSLIPAHNYRFYDVVIQRANPPPPPAD